MLINVKVEGRKQVNEKYGESMNTTDISIEIFTSDLIFIPED